MSPAASSTKLLTSVPNMASFGSAPKAKLLPMVGASHSDKAKVVFNLLLPYPPRLMTDLLDEWEGRGEVLWTLKEPDLGEVTHAYN